MVVVVSQMSEYSKALRCGGDNVIKMYSVRQKLSYDCLEVFSSFETRWMTSMSRNVPSMVIITGKTKKGMYEAKRTVLKCQFRLSRPTTIRELTFHLVGGDRLEGNTLCDRFNCGNWSGQYCGQAWRNRCGYMCTIQNEQERKVTRV